MDERGHPTPLAQPQLVGRAHLSLKLLLKNKSSKLAAAGSCVRPFPSDSASPSGAAHPESGVIFANPRAREDSAIFLTSQGCFEGFCRDNFPVWKGTASETRSPHHYEAVTVTGSFPSTHL